MRIGIRRKIIFLENSDRSFPRRIKFTNIKYNKFFRTLHAVCDFTEDGNDYLRVYYNHYIYDSQKATPERMGFN